MELHNSDLRDLAKWINRIGVDAPGVIPRTVLAPLVSIPSEIKHLAVLKCERSSGSTSWSIVVASDDHVAHLEGTTKDGSNDSSGLTVRIWGRSRIARVSMNNIYAHGSDLDGERLWATWTVHFTDGETLALSSEGHPSATAVEAVESMALLLIGRQS
ncbi:hypothetical protein KLP28_01725 [Nocardioidaceae bacterium]|nr:hypothetical protein KLP28_01725 [Nocardioidaceae bacterium]